MNAVIVMCNDKVTIHEVYETAERAYERYNELIGVSKHGDNDGVITVMRLLDGNIMAMETIE